MDSPLKAIRKWCLQCGEESPLEVRECVSQDCPLFPFRLGVDPRRKYTITEERRKELSDRFKQKHNSTESEK